MCFQVLLSIKVYTSPTQSTADWSKKTCCQPASDIMRLVVMFHPLKNSDPLHYIRILALPEFMKILTCLSVLHWWHLLWQIPSSSVSAAVEQDRTMMMYYSVQSTVVQINSSVSVTSKGLKSVHSTCSLANTSVDKFDFELQTSHELTTTSDAIVFVYTWAELSAVSGLFGTGNRPWACPSNRSGFGVMNINESTTVLRKKISHPVCILVCKMRTWQNALLCALVHFGRRRLSC